MKGFRELLLASHLVGGLYPVTLTASMLGCSRQRVHQLIESGKLEVVRSDGWVLVPWTSIEFRLSKVAGSAVGVCKPAVVQ